MQEFKKIDLVCMCNVDTFKYDDAIRSGCICDMLVLGWSGVGILTKWIFGHVHTIDEY